jgi:hypothetical protein
MSATGVTVVVSVSELLAALVSVSVDVTLAVFEIVGTEAAVVVTVMLTVALAPLLIVPRLQVSTPATGAPQAPCDDVAVTKFVVAGKVSVSVTPVALLGPAFVTVTV